MCLYRERILNCPLGINTIYLSKMNVPKQTHDGFQKFLGCQIAKYHSYKNFE